MPSITLKLTCFAIALTNSVEIVHAQTTIREQVSQFLEQHCFDCHSGDTPESGLNLQSVSDNVADAEIRRRWVYLYDRVANGEMPPEYEARPDAEAKSKFLHTLGESLTRADLANREVILRRLNRNEYENTLRDLFGIYVDVKRLLPEDSTRRFVLRRR